MSLRSFHVVFVSCAAILCAFTSLWAYQEYLLNNELGLIVAALFSLLLSVALIAYGAKVWKKLRVLNTFGASVMLNVLLISILILNVQRANACPSCYGDPNSSAAEGLNAAVLLLVGITGGVFAALGAFFLRLRRGMLATFTDSDNHVGTN